MSNPPKDRVIRLTRREIHWCDWRKRCPVCEDIRRRKGNIRKQIKSRSRMLA